MTTAERTRYVLLASLVWLYVIIRAALVPWVHDESTSLYWFLEREQFLPYVALWDAGNHFLSSAIGVLGHKLWGLSLFGSRAGSVLAFPLFAWAVFLLGCRLEQRTVRWLLWSALLACPFVLDFFSLFRGYALGIAFGMLALEAGLRFRESGSDRHLFLLLACLALAAFATLSLVPLWTLVVTALAGVLLRRFRGPEGFSFRTATVWSLAGVLPLLVGLLLAWEMRRRGLLYHGSLDGFGTVTLASLSKYVLGNSGWIARGAVVLLVLLGTGWALRTRKQVTPLLVIAGLLWSDVLMRIGMAVLLGVNYPEDRAAIHLVPLTILLAAFGADAAQRWRPGLYRTALPLLFFPLRTIWTANVDHTLLWPEQSVPTRFLEQISTLQKGAHRPFIFGAYNQLSMALPYAAKLHGLVLNLPEMDAFPTGPHDVRIVDDRFLAEALPGFVEVDHAPGPGLRLLVAKPSLRTVIFGRPPFDPGTTDQQRIEVYRGDTLATGQEVLVQLRCVISSPAQFLDLDLVIEELQGDSVLYQRVHHLPVLRTYWQGEELHVVLRMPALAGADQRSVHFRNKQGVPITFGSGMVKLHRTNVILAH